MSTSQYSIDATELGICILLTEPTEHEAEAFFILGFASRDDRDKQSQEKQDNLDKESQRDADGILTATMHMKVSEELAAAKSLETLLPPIFDRVRGAIYKLIEQNSQYIKPYRKISIFSHKHHLLSFAGTKRGIPEQYNLSSGLYEPPDSVRRRPISITYDSGSSNAPTEEDYMEKAAVRTIVDKHVSSMPEASKSSDSAGS